MKKWRKLAQNKSIKSNREDESQLQMKGQIQPNNTDDERPKYMEPKIKYPSYQDYANEGPASPCYSESRGYKEYR